MSPSAPATLTPEQQLAQDIALVMENALERQRSGAFAEAQALYEAILDAMPAHADARYNLAVLMVDTGRPADALPHFEAALGANPANGYYWVSYIHALHRSGQTPAAWIAVEIAQQRGVRGPALDGLIAQMAMPDARLATA
ncbi:glycosyltransferase, partial [Burkholderia multivorans]